MSYYYGGWAPYVSVAERRRKAEHAAAKAAKSGARLSPIVAYRGAIAKTFWGKAWSDNLESYSDYANRLPRGRTYARNGSVIDLQIAEGEVKAQVMGSSLYKVAVKVAAVSQQQWRAISADCAGSIDSLVGLLQGKLSTAVMQRICTPRTGLFPAPREISFSCSCPDMAAMCKHVAAVLYGVGARLDQRPELLFSLRRVDAKDLVSQAGAGLPTSKKGPAAGKVLDDSMLADVFGIEMDDSVQQLKRAVPERKAEPAKPAKAKQQASAKAAASKKSASARPAPGKKSSPAKAVARKAVTGKSATNTTTGKKTPVRALAAKKTAPAKQAAGKAARRRKSG